MNSGGRKRKGRVPMGDSSDGPDWGSVPERRGQTPEDHWDSPSDGLLRPTAPS